MEDEKKQVGTIWMKSIVGVSACDKPHKLTSPSFLVKLLSKYTTLLFLEL